MAHVTFLKNLRPLIFVRPPTKRRVLRSPWRGTNSVPSWSWRGHEGERTTVEVYTIAPIVKLYVNDVHVGTRRTRDYHADFGVTYEPGRVTAIVCTAEGLDLGSGCLVSAEGDLHVRLRAERGRGGVCFVRVSLVDEDGTVESALDRELTATVEGGELLAFGSACPKTERGYLEGTFPTYHGHALACVRPAAGRGGCVVRVTDGEGLSAEIEL